MTTSFLLRMKNFFFPVPKSHEAVAFTMNSHSYRNLEQKAFAGKSRFGSSEGFVGFLFGFVGFLFGFVGFCWLKSVLLLVSFLATCFPSGFRKGGLLMLFAWFVAFNLSSGLIVRVAWCFECSGL